MTASFLALYRGPSIPQAKLVAVSADPATVADFAARLLGQPPQAGEAPTDPVLDSIEQGRRQALRLIARGDTSREGIPGEVQP